MFRILQKVIKFQTYGAIGVYRKVIHSCTHHMRVNYYREAKGAKKTGHEAPHIRLKLG
jgi:hypothetical protein